MEVGKEDSVHEGAMWAMQTYFIACRLEVGDKDGMQYAAKCASDMWATMGKTFTGGEYAEKVLLAAADMIRRYRSVKSN